MLGKIADGQVGAGSGWVSVGAGDDLLPCRRGTLEFRFRRETFEHCSGEVTDQNRAITSDGTHDFPLNCDGQLPSRRLLETRRNFRARSTRSLIRTIPCKRPRAWPSGKADVKGFGG